MPRVSDLRDELDKRVNELEKIQRSADARSDKKLTPDEIKRFKELDAEIRDYEEQIAVAERADKILTQRQADDAGDNNERGRKPAPNITNVRDLEAERGFDNLGQQFRAIIAASAPGGSTDKRLLAINDVGMRAATGSGETVLGDGGFLVQAQFAKEILKRSYSTGNLVGQISMVKLDPGKNGLKLNVLNETSRANGSRWGGLQLYWKGEASQYEASKPSFREMNLELKKLTGLWYVTDELMADASAMESIAMQGFTEEFGFVLDDAVFQGAGGPNPKGFKNSGALVTVAKETSQVAATIVLANLAKMEARLLGPSSKNAIWLAHKTTKSQIMQLAIGNQPVYTRDVHDAIMFEYLLGRRILFMEQCADLGTVNDIMLVDPKEIIGIKQNDLEVASSIHVRFIYGEQVFRFTHRFDCQPTLNAAISPANGGSATETAYVTLATRA